MWAPDGVAPVLSLSTSYCCCLMWAVSFARSLMCFINGSVLEYPVAILMVSTDIVIFWGSAELTLSTRQRIGVFVCIDAGGVVLSGGIGCIFCWRYSVSRVSLLSSNSTTKVSFG